MTIYLSLCFITLAGAIGGIVYLQRAGRAGKYAWTDRDTQLLSGCSVQIVLFIPFIFLCNYILTNIAPTFSTLLNPWVIGILIYILLSAACGGFNVITERIIKEINRKK